MKELKKEFKVHFIGVGGVSMSGLAEYFLKEGFTVSGSDRAKSENTLKLECLGVKIFIGHSEENIGDAHAIIYSDAISNDNPELKRALEEKRYVISRAQALKMIAENFGQTIGVAGCHGKTTVTSMIAHILKCANMQFCAHIGGEDLKLGNFVYLGSKLFLSEVCEFKQNINFFTADFPVILNFGIDHMDCYKSEEELILCYENFAKRGYKSIISGDDEVLSSRLNSFSVRFSVNGKGEITAENVSEKGGKYFFDLYNAGVKKGRIKLKVYGEHNVKNALAAATCALQLGIKFKYVKRGLENFIGVKRRFEKIGKLGKGVVIADYAHHPTEIESSLLAANKVCKGKVYLVFQPHTYTRTLYLKDEFIKVLSKVENLALYKTYAARENVIKGASAEDLSLRLSNSKYFEDLTNLINFYAKRLKRNDMLLVLGAGDLYNEIKSAILS